jgi:hypothetical protein
MCFPIFGWLRAVLSDVALLAAQAAAPGVTLTLTWGGEMMSSGLFGRNDLCGVLRYTPYTLAAAALLLSIEPAFAGSHILLAPLEVWLFIGSLRFSLYRN